MLFLHEVIDIVGEGARRYMELTERFDTEAAADRGLTLFGTWQVVGVTGRWPQVVDGPAVDDLRPPPRVPTDPPRSEHAHAAVAHRRHGVAPWQAGGRQRGGAQ